MLSTGCALCPFRARALGVKSFRWERGSRGIVGYGVLTISAGFKRLVLVVSIGGGSIETFFMGADVERYRVASDIGRFDSRFMCRGGGVIDWRGKESTLPVSACIVR